MFCKHCGKEIADHVKFCNYCGTKVVQEDTVQQETVRKEIIHKETVRQDEEQKSVGQTVKAPVLNKKLAVILAGAGALVVILFTALMLFSKSGGEAGMAGVSKEERNALYPVEKKETDIFLADKTPGERDASAEWDSTVFYTLEDVSPDVTDGQIAGYDVSYRRFYDTGKDCPLLLEIYTNPQTGVIGKIAAVFETGGILDLYDCYYEEDGTLNFIYHRTDSIYTPSYATIGKVGERFYFNNDAMIRWRHVDEPNVVIDDVLAIIGESNYTRRVYDEMDSTAKSNFDTAEVQMLSAGYHIYEAANNAMQYGVLTGYVKNEDGTPAGEAEVTFYANNGGYKVGTVSADANGYYETGITYDEAGYRIEISEKGKRTVTFYDIVPTKENDVRELAEACLITEDIEDCPVSVSVFDEGSYVYDEAGNLAVTGIADANVTVREGLYHYTGDAVFEGTADAQGNVNMSLQAGMYTLEIRTGEGYPSYQTITVKGTENVKIPVVKGLTGNEMKIVLTWDGDLDLDSCLFTPYKAENGDMASINSLSSSDMYGNRLMADSKNGNVSETIYIADKMSGTFKYYVSDYTNCLNGNVTADDMRGMRIRVQVYDADGLAGVYTIPAGEGVIWEVFTIQNGKINPVQKRYANLDGKTWWLTDKEAYLAEEDARLAQVLSEKNEYGYLTTNLGNLLTDICYFYIGAGSEYPWEFEGEDAIQENLNRLCAGDSEELISFNGWNSHKITEHVAPVPYALEGEAAAERWRSNGGSEEDVECLLGAFRVEQIHEIASSITGKNSQVDISNLKCDGEFVFMFTGNAGTIDWETLENISVIRTGTGVWEVSAEVWHRGYEPPDVKVADITFTITRNPASIYDGYSLAGATVSITDNFGWRQDYYNYMTTDAEFKEWIEAVIQEAAFRDGGLNYSFIYVDEDAVPELYIEGGYSVEFGGLGSELLSWNDGEVTSNFCGYYGVMYEERKGLVWDSENPPMSMMYFDDIYKLEGGKLNKIAGGSHDNLYDVQYNPEEYYAQSFSWNDTSVTGQQYEELLEQALAGHEMTPCYPDVGFYAGTYDDLLNELSR